MKLASKMLNIPSLLNAPMMHRFMTLLEKNCSVNRQKFRNFDEFSQILFTGRAKHVVLISTLTLVLFRIKEALVRRREPHSHTRTRNAKGQINVDLVKAMKVQYINKKPDPIL